MEVVIRGGTPDDVNFVKATWAKSLYNGSSYYSPMDSKTFLMEQTRVIQNILLKASISLRVACLPDDPSIVLGYAVLNWENSRPILNYIYVKGSFRQQGIANKLLEGADIEYYTARTDKGDALFKKKNYKFNSFLT